MNISCLHFMQKSVKKYCHDCFLCYNDNRHSREGGIEFYSNRLYIDNSG